MPHHDRTVRRGRRQRASVFRRGSVEWLRMRELPHLTPSAFYTHAKCPNWTYWDLFGDASKKGEVPPMLQKLREDGVLHEKEVIKGLGPFEEVPSEGETEELAAATLELMRKGVPLIYQGTLSDGDWS